MAADPSAAAQMRLRLYPYPVEPMRRWQRALTLSGVAAGLFLGVSAGRAGNVLDVSDGDATPQTATVSPGDSITLLVLLTGVSESTFDSFLCDVGFSVPGLLYQSYAFDETAFHAGNPNEDFSIPRIANLPQPPASPHVITAASFSSNPLLIEVVDIHFEGLSAIDAAGLPLVFGTGVLVRIRLSVPSNFETQEVLIEAVPDTFALGSEIFDTLPGAEFHLFVSGATTPGGTPGPGTGPVEPVDPGSATLDDDGDRVVNESDLCADTPEGVEVDEHGCPVKPDSLEPLPADADADSVADDVDACPDTPPGVAVDATGCMRAPSSSPTEPTDSNGDGVVDDADLNPDTPPGTDVGADGDEVDAGQPPAGTAPRSTRGICGVFGMVDLFWFALGLTAFGSQRKRP